MTYEKLGSGEAPFAALGADEATCSETGLGESPRVGLGWKVSPTQRLGSGVSPRSASGWELRLQDTTLEFDSSVEQHPTVRFIGPCSRPYVENVTRGKALLVRTDVPDGDELVLDMATHTVRLEGDMVWGYSGRWFPVAPGDVIRAGAEGVGANFEAYVDVEKVDGLIVKQEHGTAVAILVGSGPKEVA